MKAGTKRDKGFRRGPIHIECDHAVGFDRATRLHTCDRCGNMRIDYHECYIGEYEVSSGKAVDDD